MSFRDRRWSYLIEVGLFLAIALAVDVAWGTGDRFARVQPHPFWAIVLLMAVQYGTREALVATAASAAALLAGNLPRATLELDVHEYALQVLRTPLLWMLAAVVLGELRLRHHQQHVEVSEQLQRAERRAGLLAQAHTEVLAAKDRLETRLAGQMGTATGLLEAARSLETLEPGKVIAGVSDLVEVALHARSFSVFLLSGNTLALAAQRGWSTDRTLAERYTASAPLFNEVVGAQRFVTVATPDGEAVLSGHGLMAGPLVDPGTGRLLGMLKVEDMPFLDFNLSSVQTFKALCGWIAAAYAHAVEHRSSQIQDAATQLYGVKYLDRQTAYVTELGLRFGFDLSLLLFRVDVDELTEGQRREIPAALGEVSRRVLRRTDLVFSHEPPGTQFAVLLPGTPLENVAIVAAKLRDRLIEHCGYPVTCHTVGRALCRAQDSESRDQLRGTADDQHRVA
jgi:GGDEF domain-containing protein